ncbi:MAG: hypothetical protein HY904_22125 [Deltaproteobacteria bacterium]|nr:hypothetical protein [Deltaproteobacteria bacterium]
MPTPTVISCDTLHCVSEWNGNLIITWHGPPEATRIAAIRKSLEAMLTRGPAGIMVIMDAERPFPPADARAEAAAMLKALGKQLTFLCVLYQGDSVVANLLFATIRTLSLVVGSQRVHLGRSLDDTAAFVAARLGTPATPAQVKVALDAVRAQTAARRAAVPA